VLLLPFRAGAANEIKKELSKEMSLKNPDAALAVIDFDTSEKNALFALVQTFDPSSDWVPLAKECTVALENALGKSPETYEAVLQHTVIPACLAEGLQRIKACRLVELKTERAAREKRKLDEEEKLRLEAAYEAKRAADDEKTIEQQQQQQSGDVFNLDEGVDLGGGGGDERLDEQDADATPSSNTDSEMSDGGAQNSQVGEQDAINGGNHLAQPPDDGNASPLPISLLVDDPSSQEEIERAVAIVNKRVLWEVADITQHSVLGVDGLLVERMNTVGEHLNRSRDQQGRFLADFILFDPPKMKLGIDKYEEQMADSEICKAVDRLMVHLGSAGLLAVVCTGNQFGRLYSHCVSNSSLAVMTVDPVPVVVVSAASHRQKGNQNMTSHAEDT
jgi:hypothetical protein